MKRTRRILERVIDKTGASAPAESRCPCRFAAFPLSSGKTRLAYVWLSVGSDNQRPILGPLRMAYIWNKQTPHSGSPPFSHLCPSSSLSFFPDTPAPLVDEYKYSECPRRKWPIAHAVTVAGGFTEKCSSKTSIQPILHLSYGCCTQDDETDQ